jgi:hypothetical protein
VHAICTRQHREEEIHTLYSVYYIYVGVWMDGCITKSIEGRKDTKATGKRGNNNCFKNTSELESPPLLASMYNDRKETI